MFIHFPYLVERERENHRDYLVYISATGRSVSIFIGFYYVVFKQHIHASWVDWNRKHISEKKLLLGQ